MKKQKIKTVDDLSVAAIRANCIDMINTAKSGHPGAALSCAPILFVLYKNFMNADPKNPNWINRDRFVLSCGHASSLLYTVLHLCKFNISIDDLKQFRQYGSITPGHPEVGVTDGIDAGSGPLGQGIAEAVGLAMAESMLRAKYGSKIYNHYTYCMCGDGCLQEGISQEAITFAGLEHLNKLILLYDANDVTLDGPLAQSNKENTIERFLSAGWDVIYVKDGNNLKDIAKSIKKAKKSISNPTLIIYKTIIGFGSVNQGTHKVHGSPLGAADGEKAKEFYGYVGHNQFELPQEVYKNFEDSFYNRGQQAFAEHALAMEELKKNDEKIYNQVVDFASNDISKYLNKLNLKIDDLKFESTRNASHRILNYFHELLPNFVGGSADVAGSVKTELKNGITYSPEHREGTNINWGIREFLMQAASNGILLHGGLRTYTGSFFVFSDYAKSAIRMAALMKCPNLYLLSHDSVMVGEDGPTHQPIEHLAALRSVPNLLTFRPCDSRETYASYRIALEQVHTPSALILSRQDLPLLKNSSDYDGVKKGAYIVDKESLKVCKMIIIATGSEVSLAIEAKKALKEKGKGIRIVSMPCMELFDQQTKKYKDSIIGKDYTKRVSLEMASTFGWGKYASNNIGYDHFGASAKAEDVVKHIGFGLDSIVKKIQDLLK